MRLGGDEAAIRSAAFTYLDRLSALHPDGALPSRDINLFSVNDRPLRLIVQTGIWKPAGFEAALSIRTTYTAPTELRPYADDIGVDGRLRYKYRGSDPQHSDNRALRTALQQQTPLIYFFGVGPGLYTAHYPAWIAGEDPTRLEFSVALDEAQRVLGGVDIAWTNREYSVQLTKRRLHQPVFRTRVLRAYKDSCAMCRLRHPELLDAAHILPDTHPRGVPVVPNGLALCKIHHAAFDANLVGIRPDLVIEVDRKVLEEVDGPMLRHGLQALNKQRISVPHSRGSRPDGERLAERYEQFKLVS